MSQISPNPLRQTTAHLAILAIEAEKRDETINNSELFVTGDSSSSYREAIGRILATIGFGQ